MNDEFEERFISVIRHQLEGLSNKVLNDFSKENYEYELASLESDPVYQKFSFNRGEYVLVRFMGVYSDDADHPFR